MLSQRLVSRGIFSKGVAKRDSLARKEAHMEANEAKTLLKEEKENMRNTFLWSLRREINMICAAKLSDAEEGCLFFSGAIRSMSFLSGMLTVAQTLDILTFEEWEEYNAALMEIEREMYDMAR